MKSFRMLSVIMLLSVASQACGMQYLRSFASRFMTRPYATRLGLAAAATTSTVAAASQEPAKVQETPAQEKPKPLFTLWDKPIKFYLTSYLTYPSTDSASHTAATAIAHRLTTQTFPTQKPWFASAFIGYTPRYASQNFSHHDLNEKTTTTWMTSTNEATVEGVKLTSETDPDAALIAGYTADKLSGRLSKSEENTFKKCYQDEYSSTKRTRNTPRSPECEENFGRYTPRLKGQPRRAETLRKLAGLSDDTEVHFSFMSIEETNLLKKLNNHAQ